MNPLLDVFTTTDNAVPFDKIKPEHFVPALEEQIKEANAAIAELLATEEAPNFENTIAEMEEVMDPVGRTASIFFGLSGAETSEELQKVAPTISGLLSDFYNTVHLNKELAERVFNVYENRKNWQLSREQVRLLELSYKEFKRSGALVDEATKEQLREIDRELSNLTLSFGDNVLAETNAWELHITDESELAGLPDMSKQAAAAEAKSRDKEGWVFTLQVPSFLPLLKYADNRDIRKTVAMAHAKLGSGDNEHNNEKNVLRIAELRHKRAQLLGYENHAHYTLENRMAGSPARVAEFLEELHQEARPAAEADVEKMVALLKAETGEEQLERWDVAYYGEKIRKNEFNVDENELRRYFPLKESVEGMFAVGNKLYGLVFNKVDSVPIYHEDVEVYEVHDERRNKYIGLLYIDLFPRKGKRAGAWCGSFRKQFRKEGRDIRPHVSIVCNFTPPVGDAPSLLNFREVTTLFHEFGHALHALLSECNYRSLSGTSVYWDFVELPSQILENWLLEKECLDLFAKDYETGEPIPAELVQRVRDAANTNEGFATIRQLILATIDIKWHTTDPAEFKDVNAFEREAIEHLDMLPYHGEGNTSCSFSHVFKGGYAAGYYSYKWAEVLDADAFEYFKENGIFSEKVANAFRENILSKGGSADPEELYVKFRGQKPTIKPLLKRAGFLN